MNNTGMPSILRTTFKRTTGLFRSWIPVGSALAIIVLLLAGCSDPGSSDTVIVRAQARAPFQQRVENLVLAAEQLNQEYERQGRATRVRVETSLFSGNWDEYLRNLILAFQSGRAPDIWVTRHAELGWMARDGFILSLEEEIRAHPAVYDAVFDNLWDPVTYAGERWAVPLDVELRVLYYRKDVLRALGWTEQEILELPNQVQQGNFTLDDLTTIASEAVSRGLVSSGILHRPNDGPEFPMLLTGFGARIEDPVSGRLVVDREPTLQMLEWLHVAARTGAINPATTQMDWSAIHSQFINGRALFLIGAAHHWLEWQQNSYHEQMGNVDQAYLSDHVGFMLFPAAHPGAAPFTLAHPLTYVINSKSTHADVLMDLVRAATDPDLQVRHSLSSGHLVALGSAVTMPEYLAVDFLQAVAPMMAHSQAMPNHPDFMKYRRAVFKVVQGVETGLLDPEQALTLLEQQLRIEAVVPTTETR
jgi:inositol-phosphate transport system substrate-binding protein